MGETEESKMVSSQETDPFDRVVAREAELRERQDRVERVSPRQLGMRATFGSLMALAMFFPLTWFFAREITWLVAAHIFVIVGVLASLVIIWLLPESAFQESETTPPASAHRTSRQSRSRSKLAGSASGFVLFLALLPITLIYGRHLTWLVVTHFVLIALTLGDLAQHWLKGRFRKRLSGSLSFFALVAALLPLTLIYWGHITWLVITHFVLLAIALSDVVSGWLRQRDRFDI
jgi:predicted MFS family arabinose efflux permease